MFSSQVVRRFLVPAATVVAEAKQHLDSDKKGPLCRPSELPIYTQDPPRPLVEAEVDNTASNALENAFKIARETVTKYTNEVKAYQRVGTEYLKDGKNNAEWLINYLQEENNTSPKAGAIGIGALTGLIFGLRGGFIKRTLYATSGALGMAAVCYPKEAAEYSQTGLAESKKYLTIAYNFIYGVKKEDPPLELPSLPKLPSSLPEAWDSVKKSAMSFVSDESTGKPVNVSQTTDKPPEKVKKDAMQLVTQARDNAISKSCDCEAITNAHETNPSTSSPTGITVISNDGETIVLPLPSDSAPQQPNECNESL